jgi:hypothetical protein
MQAESRRDPFLRNGLTAPREPAGAPSQRACSASAQGRNCFRCRASWRQEKRPWRPTCTDDGTRLASSYGAK